jgi:dynactin 1
LAENQIEDLKIRLDDVIGAEDLAVQLTEKNLNLNEVRWPPGSSVHIA